MEKGVIALILVLVIFLAGVVLYLKVEFDNSASLADSNVPYANVASGLLSEMTPSSILDNKDIQFWSENKLIKKQFFIDTKFGQSKENNLIFNYTISNSEDCEKEFDKENYKVSTYYQTAGIGTDKYNLYLARTCWIESVSPVKLECEGAGEDELCLYASRVSCVCLYANQA